jgi:hypothetical protein
MSKRQQNSNFDFPPVAGGRLLVPALLGGVVLGVIANILIVTNSHGFWTGLLGHSVFGIVGFGLVLSLGQQSANNPSV